jgi:hypothetical protein
LLHLVEEKWDKLLVWFLISLIWFCSEEDRKWFMEAMQANTIDVVKRMKEITQVMKTPEDVLQSQGVTPENIEGIVWAFQCFLS